MSGGHNMANVECKGFNQQTGRLHYTIASESVQGHVHHFTTSVLGEDSRCTCISFVQRGYCTLTQQAPHIARATFVARYDALSGDELARRHADLAAVILARKAGAEDMRLYSVCAEVLRSRVERALLPERVEAEPLETAA